MTIADLHEMKTMGLHESITVIDSSHGETICIRVPGGWLYQAYRSNNNKKTEFGTSTSVSECISQIFVPEPKFV